jgi:lipoprotein-anchoring transpeptidase ErfK/SrfK
MKKSVIAIAAAILGFTAVPASAQSDVFAFASWREPQKISEPVQVAPSIPREIVSIKTTEAPGTIIVNTAERRLYLVLENGKAMRYGVGVGRPGFAWVGEHKVSMMRQWPDWRPPAEMLKRRPDLPRHMAGGPENPLGARAMYLGNSIYRIHGSNEPESIGHAVSSGCIRMTNEDVTDLYARVRLGTKVIVR